MWACVMCILPVSASAALLRVLSGLRTGAASAAGRRSPPLTAGYSAPVTVLAKATLMLWQRSYDGSRITPLCAALHVTVCFRSHCTLVSTAVPAALHVASAWSVPPHSLDVLCSDSSCFGRKPAADFVRELWEPLGVCIYRWGGGWFWPACRRSLRLRSRHARRFCRCHWLRLARSLAR